MNRSAKSQRLIAWLGLWLRAMVLSALGLALATCGLQNREVPPEDRFTKIYNNPSFDNITAIDFKQTNDGGYVILGSISREGSNDLRIPYLLKVGPTGETEWDSNLIPEFANYTSPVAKLKVEGTDYTFFCARQGQLVLVRVRETNRRPEVIRTLVSANARPYYAETLPEGGFLILANQPNCQSAGPGTQLIKTDAALNPSFDQCYPGISLSSPLFNQTSDEFAYAGSFTLNGRQVFYFNAWYRNDLSLLFIDATSGAVIKEYTLADPVSQAKTLFSGLAPLGGNRFASAFANGATVFLNAQASLLNADPAQDTRLGALGAPFHELRPEKRVHIRRIQAAGREVVAMAASARNNQIALFLFQPGTNNLRGRAYFGSTNPYVPNGLIQTADGGLAIIGTTTVASRFARIVLIKLSATDLANLANQCQALGLCN